APDGKTLACGTSDGSVTLWDLTTNRRRPASMGHGPAVRSVAYSADGKTLASASGDGTVKVWDVVDPPPTVYRGARGVAWALAFSPDGKELAFSHDSLDDSDDSVKLWDMATGQVRVSLEREARSPGGFLGIAFSPDGKTVAASSYHTQLWDRATGRRKARLEGGAWSLGFSPNGEILAWGDSSIPGPRDVVSGRAKPRFWDLATGREHKALSGHRGEILSMQFSPDGKTVATGSRDRTVRLWDVAAGQERATLKGHSGAVWSLAFSPDGNTVVSAGGDLKVWDVKTGQERATLKGDTSSGAAFCLAISPDGKTLASARQAEGLLTLW